MERIIEFLFIDRRKVLLTYKKGTSGKYDQLQIPQGVIEERDQGHTHAKDAEHALVRLIYEQFGGTVIPLQYEHIATMKEDNQMIEKLVYFVYAWEGDHPLYVVKDAERVGKLRFMQVDEALIASADRVQREILKLAKEKIRIRSVLLGRV